MKLTVQVIGRTLALLLVAPALCAQTVPVCSDPGSTLLWKVEAGERDLHLFGSIHVGKPEFYPLPEVVDAAFQQAEYLVFEVDPASAANPAAAQEIQRRGLLPAGQNLAEQLSPDTLERLRTTLGSLGLPPEQFMGMKPWLLSLLLTSMQVTREGYLPQFGIEFYLYTRKPRSAQVLELESLEEQLGFLEMLNAESFLRFTLDGLEPGKQELAQLIEAWRCADHESLRNLLFPPQDDLDDPALRADMEKLMATLFHERNQTMAQDIQTFLEEGQGDYFVVVGAGHLIGEGSIVELLRAAGHRVTSLRNLP